MNQPHRLPDGFLWGASTAAHQIEGNNTASDWWANEQAGRSRGVPSGDACDSYHRYAEDVALLADAGLTAYRFSIEWARIEPARDQFSRAALLHYRDMIDVCRAHGVTPVVTLHHFTFPRWFAESGGWKAPDALERFSRYVEYACGILGDVEWVITINEPNMMGMMEATADKFAALAAAQAEASPLAGDGGREFAVTELMTALPAPTAEFAERLGRIHRAAVEVVRRLTPAKVGWSIAFQGLIATPDAGATFDRVRDEWEANFVAQSRGDDFIGVQNYTTKEVGPDGPLPTPPSPDNTLTGWAYTPDALGVALRAAWEQGGGVPLLVTENGIATDDDARRIAYTTGALTALGGAVAEGIDVRGYCHWTLLDNYEWGHYEPTFGLIAVDRSPDGHFARHPKPSLAWLGNVARTNGASLHDALLRTTH